MKHFITILTTLLVVTVFTSCQSSPETTLKKVIAENYEPHGFTGFEEYKTVHLCDEVREQIKTFKWKMSWDKSFYDAFRENVEDGVECTLPENYILQKYSFYKDEIKKDEVMLAHLESIEKDYPDEFNKVSFKIYKITYLAKDKDGKMIHNNCYGRFNKNDEMVAFKLTDESDWTMLSNYLSIPKFYDILLQ